MAFASLAAAAIQIGPATAADTVTAKASQSEAPAQLPSVSVARARRASFTETILVTGSLVAKEQVLISPQIEGYRIVEIGAEEGDRVKAGAVLAKLDRSALEAQLAQFEAQTSRADAAIAQARSLIVQSEATVKQAEAAFARAKGLVKTGATTQAIFDEREAAARSAAAGVLSSKDGLKLAQAEKTQIEAQLREVQVRLNYTVIAAPVEGLISRRTARLGASASATAEPLFRIIEKGEVELEAEIPEIYLPRLGMGRAATVSAAGLADRKGLIRLISPEVDTATRLGKVRIFLGDDPELRIGSFARGVIEIASSEGLAVPASAILYTPAGATVQAADNGKVRTRKVSVGLRTGDQVEILSGLKDGEYVVARSGTLLRDGDDIRAVEANPTAVSEAK